MNFFTLRSEIVEWCDNEDVVTATRAETGIEFVTAQLNRQLRVRKMSGVWERLVKAGEYRFALPEDWLGARVIRAQVEDRWVELEYLTPEMLYAKIDPSDPSSFLCYYTIEGCNLVVAPYSEETMVLMTYYSRIPALSGDNPTNWVLDENPDIYLFGALSHMETFVRNDERTQLWEARYQRALSDLILMDTRDTWSGGTLVMRGDQ